MPGDTQVLNQPIPPMGAAATRDRADSRDLSLDIAKGFGILLVVLGHVMDGLIAAGFFPAHVQWPTLTFYIIYLFHMPLFFVVSGYLASLRHRPAGDTVRKLLPTVVYPYFLWSILEGLVLAGLSGQTNSHFPLSALLKILWVPIVPYWFLYALFVSHLLYLAVRRYSHRVQLVIASGLFLLPYVFLTLTGIIPLLIFTESMRGFLFFAAGAAAGGQLKQFGRWTAITATILFVLFAILFYQSQMGDGLLAAVAQLAPGFAGIVATLAWSRVIAGRNSWIVRQLAFWGRYSMSIYVMHIFVTAGVRIALQRLKVPVMHAHGGAAGRWAVVLEIGLATLLGVFIPLAVNRLLSAMKLDKWFGVQRMQPERTPAASAAA